MKKLLLKIGLGFASLLLVLSFSVFLLNNVAIPRSQASTDNCAVNNPAIAEDLPVVGDRQTFLRLLTEMQSNGIGNNMATDSMRKEFTVSGTSNAPAAATDAIGTSNSEQSLTYSGTNLQVAGVDEADVIKTDGEYMYQISSDPTDGSPRLIVSKVYPANDLQVVSILKFIGQDFAPRELYVDKNYLVVIGDGYASQAIPQPYPAQEILPAPDTDALKSSMVMPNPYYYQPVTKVWVYDLKDKSNLIKTRELRLSGSYTSSRKIDSALYLVANHAFSYYGILQEGQEPVSPKFYDSAYQDAEIAIPYQDIRYFPNSLEPNYLLVAGLDLNAPTRKMQVNAYLGSGSNVYASTSNLYVAVSRYEYSVQPASSLGTDTLVPSTSSDTSSDTASDSASSNVSGNVSGATSNTASGIADIAVSTSPTLLPVQSSIQTLVYKFSLLQGETAYLGKGEVAGTLLNQFSMDEQSGYLRLATTSGNLWSSEQPSMNNVYILDPDMKLSGKLEGLAAGEKIYSVRFMGNRGYMVTYKTVDPLFVLDLKDPANPQVLGELKIPGYSNYLHPYDETHLIGIGKDSIEVSYPPGPYGDKNTVAYYLGMKLALFDVTDVNHPLEVFKESIGDRGTDSEVLYNHKALLFDKEKNLLALPISVYEVKDGQPSYDGIPQYGQLTFQGAYVFHVNLTSGFYLKAKIAHPQSVRDGVSPMSDQYAAGVGSPIQRILYIGNDLYTVSPNMIKVHDLESMKEEGTLVLSK